MASIEITPQILTQILGFNEEIVSIKISVLLDKNFAPKPSSILIANVNLTFSSSSTPIIITQELSSDLITESPYSDYNLLSLDGTLFILGNPNELQLLSSNCNIYYVSQ